MSSSKPAAELLGDVADVRCEIGRQAVGPIDDPVLVVAERGGAEPGGAIRLVDVAGCAQSLDGTLDPAAVVERALLLPHVEVHAEPLEAGLDAGAHALGGPGAHDPRRVVGSRRRFLRHVGRELRGQLLDVVAPVAVLGDLGAVAPRQDREPEVEHLRPEVVEVVLAGDLVADGGQHARQDVADEGATRVADVERPGRVGAHELDVDAAGLVHRAATV